LLLCFIRNELNITNVCSWYIDGCKVYLISQANKILNMHELFNVFWRIFNVWEIVVVWILTVCPSFYHSFFVPSIDCSWPTDQTREWFFLRPVLDLEFLGNYEFSKRWSPEISIFGPQYIKKSTYARFVFRASL
jgi:hypothetical protein